MAGRRTLARGGRGGGDPRGWERSPGGGPPLLPRSLRDPGPPGGMTWDPSYVGQEEWPRVGEVILGLKLTVVVIMFGAVVIQLFIFITT